MGSLGWPCVCSTPCCSSHGPGSGGHRGWGGGKVVGEAWPGPGQGEKGVKNKRKGWGGVAVGLGAERHLSVQPSPLQIKRLAGGMRESRVSHRGPAPAHWVTGGDQYPFAWDGRCRTVLGRGMVGSLVAGGRGGAEWQFPAGISLPCGPWPIKGTQTGTLPAYPARHHRWPPR